MNRIITSEVVEAYSICARKAHFLMQGRQGIPHEFTRIVEQEEAANREAYRRSVAGGKEETGDTSDLAAGHTILFDSILTAEDLEAHCDALKKVDGISALGKHSYEPVKVLGTHRVEKSQVMGLAYLSYVLSQVQQRTPTTGTLVVGGDQLRRVKLASKQKEVKKILANLRAWTTDAGGQAPPVILNQHCPCCPFRDTCRQQAEKEDSLSLLDRMTPKLMLKYQAKGIFTVNQLSYLFKSRRTRKKGKQPIRHRLELQALAIRTGKTYVERLPELSHHPVELFVDVEGIPDRGLFYLIGLLVRDRDEARHHSWWAERAQEEERIWSYFVEQAEAWPDAPIYHYGSYEKKAFQTLAKRYGKGHGLVRRLVNVASSVYGKIYFPVGSNGLKVLGRFLGATWTDPEASGLQSLVWRHRWDQTQDETLRQSLVLYNREDCEAVRVLVDRLMQIKETAASESAVDFAHFPKQHAREVGTQIHQQFERILKYAQDGEDRRGIHIRARDTDEPHPPRKKGGVIGHQAFRRIVPSKVGRIVRVASKRRCPRHHCELIPDAENLAEKTVTDLVFTRNGCGKVITKYTGKRSYCPQCKNHYGPPCFRKEINSLFGHGFKAWTIYQRIILRLPYRIVTQMTEHLFGVGMSESTIVTFLQHLADYYAATENAILQAIVTSVFVHVDETRINIQGVDHYVWVFTDGKHVAFRITETREADIVHEILAGYQGVLVSDFYPGYDALPCRQQKCLVHLLRDLNDDLWNAPFDGEFEAFAREVRDLLVPILEALDRYGLKAWHLRKFERNVERFYSKHITGKESASELTAKYQKRLQRYRESLFTFLTQDDIPWNNNMAERAIRQLAVQRKISGTFFKREATQYLLLLAVAQTCRFQGKSYLKFLLSKSKNVDEFRGSRPIKYSAPVPRPDEKPSPRTEAGEELL